MPATPQVSVIIPAYNAQSYLLRAVSSAQRQTLENIEIIIVADDGFDYATLMKNRGIRDPRIRYTTTGGIRTGCHNARNTGYAEARGQVFADLDADDLFYPHRLETLLPHAIRDGAATDNISVVSDRNDEILYRSFSSLRRTKLDACDLMRLTRPIFPIVRRDVAQPRLAGIEYAEDVVTNLQIIGRIGGIAAIGDTLSEYRVVTGSLSHDKDSAEHFEKSYTEIIKRISISEIEMPPAIRDVAIHGFLRKQKLNRDLVLAQR